MDLILALTDVMPLAAMSGHSITNGNNIEPEKAMNEIDTGLVRFLLENGRAADLAALMDGESKYCTETPENIPTSKDDVHTWRIALEHVYFVARFGLSVDKAKEGTHYYSAYPDEFAQWLNIGCMGITHGDLMAYIADNPVAYR